MDLDRLRVFLRVAELGTMRAAAAAVHRTQPAVSRSVAVLEGEIGAALFLREGRGLILTAAGRALVPHARSLLERVEEAAREVGRVAERDYFNLRLGSIDSVATFLMPDALESLRKRLPQLIVRLNTARTAVLLDRVRRDQLDLAVVAYSGAPPGVRATRIGPYALRFYGRRDRFADLADVDSREGLRRFPVVEIEPPPGDPGAEPIARASYAAASNVATVKALILAGFGVGDLVPFMLRPREAAMLVAAAIPHDRHCGLHLVTSPGWRGPGQERIETALARALAAAVREGRRPQPRVEATGDQRARPEGSRRDAR